VAERTAAQCHCPGESGRQPRCPTQRAGAGLLQPGAGLLELAELAAAATGRAKGRLAVLDAIRHGHQGVKGGLKSPLGGARGPWQNGESLIRGKLGDGHGVTMDLSAIADIRVNENKLTIFWITSLLTSTACPDPRHPTAVENLQEPRRTLTHYSFSTRPAKAAYRRSWRARRRLWPLPWSRCQGLPVVGNDETRKGNSGGDNAWDTGWSEILSVRNRHLPGVPASADSRRDSAAFVLGASALITGLCSRPTDAAVVSASIRRRPLLVLQARQKLSHSIQDRPHCQGLVGSHRRCHRQRAGSHQDRYYRGLRSPFLSNSGSAMSYGGPAASMPPGRLRRILRTAGVRDE
jgi:hypothetical protein